MQKFFSLTVLTLCTAFAAARGDVKMPPLFGDHMVLQQDIKLPVYGTAAPGEKVTVTIAGHTANTTAGADGAWTVRMDPLPVTREGVELDVAGTNRLMFKDVLVGDVWVCSGQSNMEFGVGNATNGHEALAAANNPQIRLFLMEHRMTFKPTAEPTGRWAVCTPQELAHGGWSGFSAVGYFFGKEIQADRNVPIGLIGCYWGGSPVEAWTSIEALRTLPGEKDHVTEFERVGGSFAELRTKYDQEILPAYQTAHAAWTTEFGAAQTAAMAQWKLDSAKAADAHQPAPAKPAPPKPEPTPPKFEGDNFHLASVLYNGMLAPLIPYGIKGALWYQGETNVGASKEYALVFPAMINDWRQRWGLGDFPFLFVQLAGYGPGGSATVALREAQESVLALPNTGMAVAMDVGNETDIHPKDKVDVGHRLALAGRRVAYGEKIVDSGPVFDHMQVEGGKIRVTYKSVGGGLVIGANPTGVPNVPPPPPADHLEGFELAGADGKFVPANAVIDGATVVVSADGVMAPTAVRYGWAGFPKVNLYNKEELPAVQFQTK